jgi:hypothetical protein
MVKKEVRHLLIDSKDTVATEGWVAYALLVPKGLSDEACLEQARLALATHAPAEVVFDHLGTMEDGSLIRDARLLPGEAPDLEGKADIIVVGGIAPISVAKAEGKRAKGRRRLLIAPRVNEALKTIVTP